MRVCDLCGKKYHEGIAVFGSGDDPLHEIDLCEGHYILITSGIAKLVREIRGASKK